MPGKPEGSVVRIYFDGARRLEEGDALQTPTGRTYLVVANRIQQRGKHKGRQHLACLVIDAGAAALEPGRIFPLYWYKRR
jgi:hypothetical protein